MNHSNKSITTSTPQSRSVYSRSKSIIQAPLLSFQSFSWSVKIGLCLPWEWTTTWWSIPHDTPAHAVLARVRVGVGRGLHEGPRWPLFTLWMCHWYKKKKVFEGAFAERKKRRLEPGRHVYATQLMPASKTNVPHLMLMVCRQLPSNCR